MSKFEIGYSDDSLRMPKGWYENPPDNRAYIKEPEPSAIKRLWRHIWGFTCDVVAFVCYLDFKECGWDEYRSHWENVRERERYIPVEGSTAKLGIWRTTRKQDGSWTEPVKVEEWGEA